MNKRRIKKAVEKLVSREELDHEARGLGIQFDLSLSDGGLMLRIAQFYAVQAYEKGKKK